MEWTILLAGLGGGFLVKLVEVVVSSIRDRAVAQGKREDERERFHRSRLYWMDQYGRMRSLARRSGASEDDLGPFPAHDPWDWDKVKESSS